MRLGFDAKRLFFNHTGLGVYSRNLISALSKQFPHHQYFLFAKNPAKSVFFDEFSHLSHLSSQRPLWRSWLMRSDILKAECDLFHGLSHELPLGLSKKIPTVVTMHDAIFRRDPHLFPWFDRKIYDLKWSYSAKHASKIIAVSESTKLDLQEFYHVPKDKIEVIPPPISFIGAPSDHPNSDSELEKAPSLPTSFFLYVGALNPRKNLIGIIRAYTQLPRDLQIPLVVVGKENKYSNSLKSKIHKEKLDRKFVFVGQVSNRSLARYYQKATALIYPSFYEGFGLPIVEALHHKTPVITSNISSMPEAAGPGAILIDPNQPSQIANAMITVLQDSELARRLANAGHDYISRFNADQVSNRVEALYRKLV